MPDESSRTPPPAGERRGLGHNPFAQLKAKLGGTPAPSAAKPAPAEVAARVTVRRERAGRGGKTVTLAEGPGLAGRDVEALSREAAKALGTGARVESGALVVQGDQSERLMGWLASRGFAGVVRGN